MLHSYHCPSDVSPEFNPSYAGYATSTYVVVHGAGVREVGDDIDRQGNGAFSEASSVSFLEASNPVR